MKITTKRLLSLLLAVLLCVSLLPAAALAADEAEAQTERAGAKLRTEETKKGLTVTGLEELPEDGVLVIPAEIGGKRVWCIGEGAFLGVTGLKRVIIPATVTQIGSEAFRDCADLLNAEFLGEAPNAFGTDVFLHCGKDFAMWHRGGRARTYCVLHGYPYYYKPEEFTTVYHSFSGKTNKNSVETVPTNVELSDALFEGEAKVFNYELAKLSLCFAMSSSINLLNGGQVADVAKYESMVGYDAQGSAESVYNRPDRFLRQCLEGAGFENDYYQYRYSDTTSEDNDEAYGVAWKKLDDGRNLVAVVIRSNGYGGGWVSNVTVAGGEYGSRGFYESANNIVYGGTESCIPVGEEEREQNLGLLPYLEAHGLDPENTRIWVSGFSRGGAVANCIGGILQSESGYNAENDNLMVYSFATPRTVDKDNLALRECPSVFSVVQEMDLVPQMPLQGWGFYRFGTTYALPCRSLNGAAYTERLASASKEFSKLMRHFGRSNKYAPFDGQEQLVDEITKLSYVLVPGVSEYEGDMEASLRSVCSVFMAGNPGNVDTDSLIAYLAGETAVDDLTNLYKKVIVNKEKLSAADLFGYAHRLKYELDVAPLKAIFGEMRSYALKLVVSNAYDKAKGWLTRSASEHSEIEKTVKYFSNLCTQGFDSEALLQHWPEEYYAWLNSGTAEDTLTTRGYLRYCEKCPVDVSVYDESGTLVAQIVNENVTVSDLLVLTGPDGEKTVIIPEDQNYRVETVSRESGDTMDVTVERCTADGELVRKDVYLSVPLTEGGTFTAEVTDEGCPKIVTDADETLEADMTLYERKVCDVDVEYDGSGIILGDGPALVGDTVSLVAIPEDDSAFLGWFDENGELISTGSFLHFTAEGNRSFRSEFAVIPTFTIQKNLIQFGNIGSTEKIELVLSDEKWRDQVEWVVTDLQGNVDEEHPQSNDVLSVDDEGNVTVVGRGSAFVEARLRLGERVITDKCGVNVGSIHKKKSSGSSTFYGTGGNAAHG